MVVAVAEAPRHRHALVMNITLVRRGRLSAVGLPRRRSMKINIPVITIPSASLDWQNMQPNVAQICDLREQVGDLPHLPDFSDGH